MRTSDVIPMLFLFLLLFFLFFFFFLLLLLLLLHCIYRVPIMTLLHSSRHVLDAACYTINIISRHKVMTTTFSANQKILNFDIMSRIMEIVLYVQINYFIRSEHGE